MARPLPIAFSLLLLLTLLSLGTFSASAQSETPQRIIVNSENWVDVYSVMQYGAFKGITSNFLVSDRHASLILGQVNKNERVWAITSSDTPFFTGFEALLTSRGYSSEEFTYDNINLEMAQLLTDVDSFLILDPSYGYNAIAVAPYAALSKTYVLFADADTIGDISDFLSERTVRSVIIFGQVDREVKAALTQYNPEIINKDGDRFLNNVEIVKKYREISPAKQVILTNGEFIEQEVMAGAQPVVFIGTNNVPDAIRDYVSQSDIEVGVLIGNELVGTATFIRRQIGISVFVKFAQGARQPEGRISQVEALDMFYLPTYTINIEIDSIKYNRATNQLEVTLRNTEDQAAYLIGTYGLTDSAGATVTVGDTSANFIDGNQVKTFVYDVSELAEGKITGDVFIIYGESAGSLEKEIRTVFDVDSVRVLDNCNIQINEVALNLRSKHVVAEVENIAESDCYTNVDVVDIIIAGEKGTFSSEGTTHITPKGIKNIKIKVPDFEAEDAEDNANIKLRAYFGERETTLIKVLEGRFELLIKRGDVLFYTLIAIIALLLGLIVWRRRKGKANPTHHAIHHK